MYVDDLVSGGNVLSEAEVIKQKSIELFAEGGFDLHKWHSNISLHSNISCQTVIS